MEIPESPDLVCFSSASGNTHRFAQKLRRESLRIPLRPRIEGMIRVSSPYVLIVPTYGGGSHSGAVPKQVIAFLNDTVNRGFLRGVMAAGNTNFGVDYCLAGPLIAAKCAVPELYRFELLGTPEDVAVVEAGLEAFWARGTSREAMGTAGTAPPDAEDEGGGRDGGIGDDARLHRTDDA